MISKTYMLRRWLIPILFVLVLVTPFVLRLVMGVSSSSTPAAGALPLVVITSHAEGVRREFREAFRAWHQKKYGTDVAVDYVAYGSNEIVNTLKDRDTAFAKLHTLGVDVAWGGGDFMFDKQLKGLLQPTTIDPAVLAYAFPLKDINGLPLYDVKNTPPMWYGAALSGFGITYNRDVLRYLGVADPQTWTDLTDPRLSNWLILADPTRSASVKQALMAVIEKAMVDEKARGGTEDAGWAKGMGTIRLIGSNVRAFVGSSESVPGYIASGDVAAGMTIDYMGRSEVEAIGGDRLGYVQPVGATIINPDPIAVVKGAEHPEVARHFIEFVLGPDGQKFWQKKAGTAGGPKTTNLRRLPVSRTVYADMTDFTDPVDPFKAAGGFNKSTQREDTFDIVGELIQCACMNNLDELRETRRAILASPRRAELEKKLGEFPYDQKKAMELLSQYSPFVFDEHHNKKPLPVDPIKRLELLRQWTQEFRTEYEVLRRSATD